MARFSKSFPIESPEGIDLALANAKKYLESGMVDVEEFSTELRVIGEVPGLERVRTRSTAPAKKRKLSAEAKAERRPPAPETLVQAESGA
jgi:hypothetical protein